MNENFTILCKSRYNTVVRVGEKIALVRRYRAPSQTQRDLADEMGVDRSTLARWETKGHPPHDFIKRLSAATGIALNWFYDGREGPPPLEDSSNARPVSPQGLRGTEESLRRLDRVALPLWRGVIAGGGDCEFWPSDALEYRETPGFLATGDPEEHVLCVASGLSMAPRIDHAEKAVVKLDPDPPLGAIVVARRPDGANFIKVLRRTERSLELHSLNPDFPPITNVKDWSLKGYVVAILHTYNGSGANIEWDDGRPLRG